MTDTKLITLLKESINSKFLLQPSSSNQNVIEFKEKNNGDVTKFLVSKYKFVAISTDHTDFVSAFGKNLNFRSDIVFISHDNDNNVVHIIVMEIKKSKQKEAVKQIAAGKEFVSYLFKIVRLYNQKTLKNCKIKIYCVYCTMTAPEGLKIKNSTTTEKTFNVLPFFPTEKSKHKVEHIDYNPNDNAITPINLSDLLIKLKGSRLAKTMKI